MESRRLTIENGILKGESMPLQTGTANVGEKILETLRSKPDFVGQVDAISGKEFTFEEMADESIRCALWMRKQGIVPGDVVCLFTHKRIDNYVPCFAALFNRAVIGIWFPGNTSEKIKIIIDLLKPKFIFTEEEGAKLIMDIVKEENLGAKIVTFTYVPGMKCLNDILKEQDQQEVDNFLCTKPLTSEDDCLVVFTSGSSAEPVPTLHTYGSIMNCCLIYSGLKKRERVSFNYAPITWICGIANLIMDTVAASKRIVVHEKEHSTDEIFEVISKYKVNTVFLGLSLIYRLYKSNGWEQYDTSSVKSITLGGTKLKPEIVQFVRRLFPKSDVQLSYASTELNSLCLLTKANNDNLDSCGFILPNVQMKVSDVQSRKVLGPNEQGELCFKSPYMMKEYYRNPGATKKAFDKDGWYHTGDLGYYNETGNTYVLGRKKFLLAGASEMDLTLWEIQRIVFLNCDVVEGIVIRIPVPEDSNEHKIVAFVTLVSGSKVTEEELGGMVKCFETKGHEVSVKILDSMPLTHNGKVKISALQNSILDLDDR